MNRTLKIAVLSLIGLNAFALGGCTVSTDTKKFVSEPRTTSAAWSSGKALTIKNGNGELFVDTAGTSAGEVQVSGIAFTFDTDEQTATDFLKSFANPTATPDGSGNIVVDAAGTGVHGYDLTVHLPSSFDGALSTDNGNGGTTLHGSPAAVSTTVHNDNGSITADQLSFLINIVTANGDVTVSATPVGQGNVISTDNGDIAARIGAANLSITAQSASGGAVIFPDSWPANYSSSSSGSATIGDGTGTLDARTQLGAITFFAQ